MKRDNPAERLHSILVEGKGIQGGTNCRQAWGQLLDAPPASSLLMARLGKLMELPGQIIELLKENYPDDGATWAHWESVVNNAFFTQNLNDAWSSFISKIDPHSLTYLKMSATMLDSSGGGKLMSEEELAGFLLSLRELFDKIAASEISDDLKKYLLRSIRKLIGAIEEYKITGAMGIQEAVEQSVGHARFDKEYFEFMRTDDLGKSLNTTLVNIASAVTIAIGLPQLGSDIAKGLFALLH